MTATGGGLVTSTVCVALAVFPFVSVATHVTVVVPFGNGPPSGRPSPRVPTRVAVPQLSTALVPSEETVAVQTPAPVGTEMFDVVITGGVLSATVTTWVRIVVFPLGSTAVYVTVVAPTGKTFPAGTPVRVTVTEQLSDATATPSVASAIVFPQIVAPGPVTVLIAAGGVKRGGVLSRTVTTCVPIALFPLGSTAV